MDQISLGNLAYLVLLTAMVGFWFFTDTRQSLGKSLRQALTWGLIILVFVGAVSLIMG